MRRRFGYSQKQAVPNAVRNIVLHTFLPLVRGGLACPQRPLRQIPFATTARQACRIPTPMYAARLSAATPVAGTGAEPSPVLMPASAAPRRS